MPTAAPPLVKNHGASGISAPTANRASELVAAVNGEPSSFGLTPNIVRAVKLKNRSSSSGSSVLA